MDNFKKLKNNGYILDKYIELYDADEFISIELTINEKLLQYFKKKFNIVGCPTLSEWGFYVNYSYADDVLYVVGEDDNGEYFEYDFNDNKNLREDFMNAINELSISLNGKSLDEWLG